MLTTGQKLPRQSQCDGFVAYAIFPGLVTDRLFLCPRPENVLKERFATAEEVTSKVMRALAEISKNGFQESFQRLYEHWQKCVTGRGNYFEKMLSK
jgi:hypothetical protein